MARVAAALALLCGCTSGALDGVESVAHSRAGLLLANVNGLNWYNGNTDSAPGTSTYDAGDAGQGTFHLRSEGRGLAVSPYPLAHLPDNTDSVHFVYTPWSAGDVEIVVRVDAADFQPSAGPPVEREVQAGVMIREGKTGSNVGEGDLDSTDLMGAGWFSNGTPSAACSPSDPDAGELSSFNESARQPLGPDGTIVGGYGRFGTRAKPPVWLRLQRVGNDYQVTRRRDGGPWAWMGGGPFTPSSEANVRIGFYVGGEYEGVAGERRASFTVEYVGRPRLEYRTSFIGASHGAESSGFVSHGMDSFFLAADGTSYKYYTDAEGSFGHSIDRFKAEDGTPMRLAWHVHHPPVPGGITGHGTGAGARIYFVTSDGTDLALVAANSDLTQTFWIRPLSTTRVGGLAADGDYVYVSERVPIAPMGQVRIFDAATGVEQHSPIPFASPPPGPLAVDRAKRLWIARTPDHPNPVYPALYNFNQNANSRIECWSAPGGAACPPNTTSLTSLNNPTALAIAPIGTTGNDRLIVALNGPQNQNVHIFTNLATNPTKTDEVGVPGGVFSGTPGLVAGGPGPRLFAPIGVGGDAVGNTWVASSAPRVEIQKFRPDDTPIWTTKPPVAFSPEPGAFDPDTLDFYTLTRRFKMVLSDNPLLDPPGSEWRSHSVTWDPFRTAFTAADKRFKRGEPGIDTSAPRFRHLPPGKDNPRFMFWQHDYVIVGIYRFDGEIALPCGSIDLGTPSSNNKVVLWLDYNMDGLLVEGETQSFARTQGMTFDVDLQGNLWFANANDGILKVPFLGVEDGIPRYDLDAPHGVVSGIDMRESQYSLVRTIRYDSARNAIYALVVRHTGLEPWCNGAWLTLSVARYQLGQPNEPPPPNQPTLFDLPDPAIRSGNADADDFGAIVWDRECGCIESHVPPCGGCDRDWNYRSFDFEGDYFFVQERYGTVHVHDADTGAEVTRLIAGPEISGDQNPVDHIEALSVVRRPTGEYLVATKFQNRRGYSVLFRWKPGGLSYPTVDELFPPTGPNGPLDGRLLTIPCGDDSPSFTDCSSGGAWYRSVLTPCSGNGLNVSHTYPVAGQPGVSYPVKFRFYGIVESKNYGSGVTRDAAPGRPGNQDTGASPTPFASAPGGHVYPVSGASTYELRVKNHLNQEVAVYYLNADSQEGFFTYVVNFEKQINVIGGGSVVVRTRDTNCREKKNCGPAGTLASQCAQKANARVLPVSQANPAPANLPANQGGLRQPNLVTSRPASASGQWLLIDVLGVN